MTGYLPSELWTAIFKLVDRDQLPELRLICVYWHNIAMSLVFTTVWLSLPFAWQLSDWWEDFECLASRSEIGALSFPLQNNIRKSIHTIIYNNWFFSPYCFFLHELPKVHTVYFLVDSGSASTVPHILYPFLLPSSIEHLVIRGCSLAGHSVEAMLSPDMELKSLELDALDNAALVCHCPYVLAPIANFTDNSIYLKPVPLLRRCPYSVILLVYPDSEDPLCIISPCPPFTNCVSIFLGMLTHSVSIYTCNFAIATNEYKLQCPGTKALRNTTECSDYNASNTITWVKLGGAHDLI